MKPTADESSLVGAPVERVEALLKVTGQAKYSAEIPLARLVYAVLVESTIASGRITTLHTAAAEQAPGVLKVISYKNAPRLARPTMNPAGQSLPILQSPDIVYFGQHIAVVVAESFEQATYAARLVKATYERTKPVANLADERGGSRMPRLRFVTSGEPVQTTRGDVAAGLTAAAVRVEQTYATPAEFHHPMEPHATTAVWEGDRLTVYDTTQGITNVQQVLAGVFGLRAENVRVINYFLGGGFGCKGWVWTHVPIAALAARAVGRPVKLVLSRQQLVSSNGHRAQTRQRVALGATADGRLTAIRHEVTNHTSMLDEFVEPSGLLAQTLYSCPNVAVSHRITRLHVGTPTITRAPGEGSGSFALESAMDELAHALNLDPLELRLRNYAERDEQANQPFSSKSLRECYQLGAEKFQWARRQPTPRAQRDGQFLVGLGMATASYPANFRPAAARAIFELDGSQGKVTIQCGTLDLGTGMYTIGSQIAAAALGVPLSWVKYELGDTLFPATASSGGSSSAASAGSATAAAAKALRSRLIEHAVRNNNAPLNGFEEKQLDVEEGRIFVKDDPARGVTYAQVLQQLGETRVEMNAAAQPGQERAEEGTGKMPPTGPRPQVFSFHSFGAHFAEVRVDEATGTIHVARFVTAIAAGKILNLRTATGQLQGGVTWGLGMALTEENLLDQRYANFVNRTLADYHVPCHLDVPPIEVHFIDETDAFVNPIGVKGIGEIGIVGAAAAIANAVFNATGKRVRTLPITLDKLS